MKNTLKLSILVYFYPDFALIKFVPLLKITYNCNLKNLIFPDSSAIADRNLKLILGLVWTLILHYSISKQIWDGNASDRTQVELSPKAKLMIWLKGKLPAGLPFTNFTSDWNDGILLGALVCKSCTTYCIISRHIVLTNFQVDSCAPDLGVDWRNWLPSQALHSTRTAVHLADDYLGVAPVSF